MFVDVHGYKNNRPLPKWERIPVEEVENWKNQNDLDTYLYTVQQFEAQDKEHSCPLYFDFDHKEDVAFALNDTIKLVNHLTSVYTDNIDIRVWFSGCKGFHVTIDKVFFGALSSTALTYYWRYVAEYYAKELNLMTLDKGVYTLPRMWRIPNTPNPKSVGVHGRLLYKVPLSIHELLTLSLDDIKRLAEKPREFDEFESVVLNEKPISELQRLYDQATFEYAKSKEIALVDSAKQVELNKELPPCIKYIFDNGGILKLGFRNRTTIVLAGYCKDAGFSIREAELFLLEWLKTIPDPSPFTSTSGWDNRKMQTLMVLKAVYGDSKYHFSCGSAHAIGIDKAICADCKSIGEEAEEVDLQDYALSKNVGGKLIVVEADVIGKDKKEMLIPKSARAYCPFEPNKNACLDCPMADYFNPQTNRCERTMTFTSKNNFIVDMTDGGAGHQHVVLQKIFGVLGKRCGLIEFDITWGNAQVIYISSKLNYEFRKEDQVFSTTAVALEHGIQMSRSYKLFGRVYQNPRTRAATFIVDKVEPLHTMLDNFAITKEEQDELNVFKSDLSASAIDDKIYEIHSLFRDSFIYVFGRDELIKAIDMVFHSVRWLKFQRQDVKGWLDILVLGDSGQAKTKVVANIMQYYELGVIASGETSSRTGLLYTIQMIAGQEAWVKFGLVPRSSGYIVCVDEIHGMPAADFKEFTRVRSEGMVDVNRAGVGKCKAETRLISIANARPSCSLASYGYPVQAITEIPAFSSLEDVRRFDYAVGVKAGDVSDDEINYDVNLIERVDHPYTANRCRNLILWLWTLPPDKIIITEKAEQWCLELAKRMSKDYIADIPLVEAGDQRLKLLRLGTAFAGRTYNSPDGEHLVVEPEHIDCAYNMLNTLYKSEGLDYYGFSEEKARAVIPPDREDELIAKVKTEFPMAESIFRYLLAQNSFNKTLLIQATGLSKDGADRLMNILMNAGFIESAFRGFMKKTTVGRKFMRLVVFGREDKTKIKEDGF